MIINKRSKIKDPETALKIELLYGDRIRKLIPQQGYNRSKDYSKAVNDGKINSRVSTRKTGSNIKFSTLINDIIALKLPSYIILDFNEDLFFKDVNGIPHVMHKDGSLIIGDYSFDIILSKKDRLISELEIFNDNVLLLEIKYDNKRKSKKRDNELIENISRYKNGKYPPTLKIIDNISSEYGVTPFSLFIPLSPEDRKLIGRKQGWLKKRIDAEQAVMDRLAQESPKELQRLLLALESEGATLPALMAALKLKDEQHFTQKYINPALTQKLIRKVKPKTPAAVPDYYKLTTKGKKLKAYFAR